VRRSRRWGLAVFSGILLIAGIAFVVVSLVVDETG
jgi:hypothetical protein